MNQSIAVLFDMDGVIADTNRYHKECIHLFCEKHGLQLSEEDMKQRVYGRTNRDWLTNLFGTIPAEKIAVYADEKEQLFREVYAPYLKPVAGLPEFLEALERNNIPKAIATSAPPANVDFVVDGTGIRNYFNTILDERMVSRGKPDPEIYLKTAQALGFPNEQCIVIEDSLSGVEAGQRAGSKVIGITTTHSREELAHCDLVIDNFHDMTIEKLRSLMP
ncbi:MAG: HAD family phosphatase [Cyclobacteriaceae bacterium]|jgi:HAD superfamily hydrolase (TIGR01509 family)|nr:HAD family phosphatase [Cyclobacteriaceae bacterium]